MHTTAATRTKGEVVRDFRTSAILDAARRVIAEQGYADASVERIAQAAGVAKGTVYLYFENKQALLSQLLADTHDESMDGARQALATTSGGRDRLRAILGSLLRTTAAGRGLFRALMAHPEFGVEGETAVSAQLRAQIDETRALLASVIGAGVASGEFRTRDPEQAARYVLALLTSSVLREVIEAPEADLEHELSDLAHFVFDGLAAPTAEGAR